MGGKNSGPRPRPSAIKGLFGVKDARRVNPHEPALEPAPETFDVPPPDLDGDLEAIAEWRSIVPTLRRVGLVSGLERAALITVCRVWSRLVRAEADILERGTVLPSGRGPALNPSVRVANDAIAQCLRLWAELGMTPSGRTRIATLGKKEAPTVSKWAGVV